MANDVGERPSVVVVTGTVKSRREHGTRLLFFDVTVEPRIELPLLATGPDGGKGAPSTATVANTIPVLGSRELRSFQVVHSLRCYPSGFMSPARFKRLTKLVMPGAVVEVAGKFGETKTKETSLFAENLTIVRVQPDPSAVVRILCATRSRHDDDLGGGDDDDLFDAKYCANALGFGSHPPEDEEDLSEEGRLSDSEILVHELQSLMLDHPGQFRREGAGIVRQLRGLPAVRARARAARIKRSDLDLLEGDHACALRASQGVREAPWPPPPSPLPPPATAASRGEKVLEGLLSRLIKNIPSTNAQERARREAYMRRKKWPQIQWMVSQAEAMVAAIRAKRNSRPLRVADIGAGRGDLSLALALTFPDCDFAVIDVNESSLRQGEALAKRLGARNVRFLLQDVACVSAFNGSAPFDLFVGLHACGGLTDAILDQVCEQAAPASFLICTCCFGKNKELRPERFRGGVFGAGGGDCEGVLCRLADSCEYAVSSKAMHAVNAGRLGVVASVLGDREGGGDTGGGHGGEGALECELRTFPREWSPRNMVLYGLR